MLQIKNVIFFRFDPKIIEERKKNILEFLYYCAENKTIYRSQIFVKFFEDVSSPEKDSSISLSISSEGELSVKEPENDEEKDTLEVQEDTFVFNLDADNYLYLAALCFSQAVQEEANLRYKSAFELYKSGIDKLLTGILTDNNEVRKKIAKTKAALYLQKAEILYENHAMHEDENDFCIEDTDSEENTSSISTLERPFANMSKFKVIEVNNRIMKVQDRTDKKMYVLKTLWGRKTQKIFFMPQKIPYMVPLQNYFHSDNAVFLLLPFVSGGLLWDYINRYSPNEAENKIDEIFVEPPKNIPIVNKNTLAKSTLSDDLDFERVRITDEERFSPLIQNREIEIETPSFDTLAPNIDIDDLLVCSQKLLKSVVKTLEKSVVLTNQIEERAVTQEIYEPSPNHRSVPPSQVVKSEDTVSVESEKIEINRKIIPLPESVIKQWASEILVCINALHRNQIILGDFNLNNLLLGSNGHIILTYFYQTCRNSFQQLCYLNPMAIKCFYVNFEFPLTKSSDFFSYGVVLFEICTMHRFFLCHPGGISKYNEIQYPSTISLSEEVKDLIHKLIFEKSDKRPNFNDLKSHPFFDGIDFDKVEKCEN